MKYVFLSIITLLSISAFCRAQSFAVDQGAHMLSGTGTIASYGGELYTGSNSNRYTTIQLSPSWIRFIRPNVAVGINTAYEANIADHSDMHTIKAGPSMGYFWGDDNSTNYPYILTSYQFHYSNNNSRSTSGYDLSLAGGIIFPVKTNLGFVVQLGYHMTNLSHIDWGNFESGNVFVLGFGLAGLFY